MSYSAYKKIMQRKSFVLDKMALQKIIVSFKMLPAMNNQTNNGKVLQ
jgi:hypothetical protein